MTSFADLGLSAPLLQALEDVGYKEPSPIQEQAIPPLLQGSDIIGQAQTGSGKTAAFGLPIMEYVDPSVGDVQALVLTPTRELCIQVTQALRAYGQPKGVDVVAVFGGAPIRTQQAQLRAGGHVVVGTVGRVMDLISRASLILHSCRFVVLDEADEMLDLGFLEDVEKILSLTPNSRQTALFSATMPPPIRKLADRYLYDPVMVKVESKNLTVDTVEQFRVEVGAKDKAAEARRAAAGRAADAGDRLRAHEDPLRPALPHAARQGHQRQGAARRHVAGLARRRDALVQERAPADPRRDRRRRARPRHLHRHARRQLRRARRRPTSTSTASAAPAASGARVARSRSSSRASSASSRRSSSTSARRSAPGRPARRSRPCRSRSAPSATRSRKIKRSGDEPWTRLIVSAGRAAGLEPADLVHAVTHAAGVDGEAVKDVLVLEQFSFLSVPQSEADRVIEKVGGEQVNGTRLALEPVQS